MHGWSMLVWLNTLFSPFFRIDILGLVQIFSGSESGTARHQWWRLRWLRWEIPLTSKKSRHDVPNKIAFTGYKMLQDYMH